MPPRARDLTGERFTRLVVQYREGSQRGQPLWKCRCDCGATVFTTTPYLKDGRKKSCGCLRRSRVTTHGLSHRTEYKVWAGMVQRCHNPNHGGYSNYGGRGVRVCPRWRKDFAAFLKDVGPRPSPSHTLDRKDGGGDYEPRNCRWATRLEQGRNRRGIHMLSVRGVQRPLNEWATLLGLNYQTLWRRLRDGWSADRILTQPHERGNR